MPLRSWKVSKEASTGHNCPDGSTRGTGFLQVMDLDQSSARWKRYSGIMMIRRAGTIDPSHSSRRARVLSVINTLYRVL